MTLEQELEQLHQATRDFGYAIYKTPLFQWLFRRFDLTPKHWIRERQTRELHASITSEMQAKIDKTSADSAASPHGGISLAEAQRRMEITTAHLRKWGRSIKRDT